MATYTLIPSSWYGSYSTTNPTNAYHDTTNTTYTAIQVYYNTTSYPAWLGGFDFSVIPQDQRITGITVKVKMARSNGTFNCALYSGVDGTQLSALQDATSTTATTYTLDLTSSLDTILNYSSTLRLRFSSTNGSTHYVYGAEIIVETMSYSKVVYDGNTLIDLTGDTATASDVAVGKTFHLASGVQATGTLSPSVATATTTGSTTRKVSFTNLAKQPSWFMMICSSTNTTARNSRVQHMLYDGTTTTTYYTNGSTAGSIATSTSYGTFTYSSGTLTITVTTAYIGAASWELYYL